MRKRRFVAGHAETDRPRKRARPLYLEIRARGLEMEIVSDKRDPTGQGIRVGGYASLSDRHRDRIGASVEENKAGLAKILTSRSDPDLSAVRKEGDAS